jgi:hypothetical protein
MYPANRLDRQLNELTQVILKSYIIIPLIKMSIKYASTSSRRFIYLAMSTHLINGVDCVW